MKVQTHALIDKGHCVLGIKKAEGIAKKPVTEILCLTEGKGHLIRTGILA